MGQKKKEVGGGGGHSAAVWTSILEMCIQKKTIVLKVNVELPKHIVSTTLFSVLKLGRPNVLLFKYLVMRSISI